MVVGFFKKTLFFSSGVNICWFRQFLYSDFFRKNYLTLSQNSYLWVKHFDKNFWKKIRIEHIPCTKNLGEFFQTIWSYRHFLPQRCKFDLFLRPHKSKKDKKSTKGVQKGTQKFSETKVGTLPSWLRSIWQKKINSRREILIYFPLIFSLSRYPVKPPCCTEWKKNVLNLHEN